MGQSLTQKRIHGVDVDFWVDVNGKFYADLGEQGRFEAKTLAEVVAEVDKVLKVSTKVKPVTVSVIGIDSSTGRGWNGDFDVREDGVVDLELRSWNSRSHELAVTLGDVKRKLRPRAGMHTVRSLTDLEKLQLKALFEAKRAAIVAIENFIGERSFDWERHFKGEK